MLTHKIAITSFSDFDKNTVLIGANCMAWPKNKIAMELRLTVINPYQSHDDIVKAAEYCWNVSMECCDNLGKLLNQIHGVSYGSSYWKALLLPWMIALVENLYDRYLRLCMVRNNYSDAVIEIPRIAVSEPLYEKSCDVYTRSHLHSVNAKIYSLLAELMGFNSNIKYLNVNIAEFEKDLYEFNRSNQINFTASLRIVKKKIKRVFNLYNEKIMHTMEVPSLKNEGFVRQILNREKIKFKYTNDEFKSILQNFVRWALPISLFEEYRERNDTAKEFLMKKNIKVVNISNMFWENDTLTFLSAHVKENCGKVIGNQHGGGYGHHVITSTERVEREIADFFISWGWTDNRASPAIPLPAPRFSKMFNIHHEKNKNILFIGSHAPMYMFRYQSYWMPEFVYQKYYPMKRIFFEKLTKPIQKYILYRTYLHEYGWHERQRIKEILPNVCFDESASVVQTMRNCSLVVIDHPSTSFIEALVINVPTILFWDKEQCPMREEAKPYFQLLLDSGILYYTPEDAANKVSEIWDDVQGWWQQPEVQKAKDEFCHQFARTNKNWRKEWVKFLRRLRDKN